MNNTPKTTNPARDFSFLQCFETGFKRHLSAAEAWKLFVEAQSSADSFRLNIDELEKFDQLLAFCEQVGISLSDFLEAHPWVKDQKSINVSWEASTCYPWMDRELSEEELRIFVKTFPEMAQQLKGYAMVLMENAFIQEIGDCYAHPLSKQFLTFLQQVAKKLLPDDFDPNAVYE
ncbi:MAG: hypothetical protein GKR91_19870 [Pseudomonadales bacterium]|nr:hypothetical protein [Pseudomonadales bacterium]